MRPDAVSWQRSRYEPTREQYKNRVLAALPEAEIDRLAPYLSEVTLKTRTQLLDGRASMHIFWRRD